jgi:hypothetical protein
MIPSGFSLQDRTCGFSSQFPYLWEGSAPEETRNLCSLLSVASSLQHYDSSVEYPMEEFKNKFCRFPPVCLYNMLPCQARPRPVSAHPLPSRASGIRASTLRLITTLFLKAPRGLLDSTLFSFMLKESAP